MKVNCICVDDTKRPNEVKLQNWIMKGVKYKIIHISYHLNQGIQGVLLEEVSTKSDFYTHYRLDRFAFRKEDIEKLIELMKSCTELNDVDIEKLIEESNLEIINN